MLVIDRGDAGLARADQADRIVASADAGLEHREVALALLEVQAGERKQRFEGAELLAIFFETVATAASTRSFRRANASSPISTPST